MRHCVRQIVLASVIVAISPAVAAAQSPAGSTIASASALTIGTSASGGGQNIDFWRIPLVGGDKVSIATSLPSRDVSGWPYKFDLFAPETADSAFQQAFPVSEVSAEVGGATSQYVAVQAPYTGAFVLAVCEYPNTGCQALAGQARVMDPYTFTTIAHPSAATLRKRKLAAALRECSRLRRLKRAACVRAARHRYG
jgi:hypothetical protein